MSLLILISILCFVFGFVAGFPIGAGIRQKAMEAGSTKAIQPAKHEHIWTLSSTEKYNDRRGDYRPIWMRVIEPSMNTRTRVLRTCFCGEVSIDELEGHWTKEELTV